MARFHRMADAHVSGAPDKAAGVGSSDAARASGLARHGPAAAGAHLLRRDEAEAWPGAGAAMPAAARVSRRADQRAGSARPAVLLRSARAGASSRDDDLFLVAHSLGGRTGLRSRGDSARRPAR